MHRRHGATGEAKSAPYVFVSSTWVDLAEHRRLVRDVLVGMEFYPDAMEDWGAQGAGDPTSVSLDRVAGCVAYAGIIAWRYGFIPDHGIHSVTHLEYLDAQRLGKPCFLFLAHPSTESLSGPDDPFPVDLRDPDHEGPLR